MRQAAVVPRFIGLASGGQADRKRRLGMAGGAPPLCYNRVGAPHKRNCRAAERLWPRNQTRLAAGHAAVLIKTRDHCGHCRSTALSLFAYSHDISVSQPHPHQGLSWSLPVKRLRRHRKWLNHSLNPAPRPCHGRHEHPAGRGRM